MNSFAVSSTSTAGVNVDHEVPAQPIAGQKPVEQTIDLVLDGT